MVQRKAMEMAEGELSIDDLANVSGGVAGNPKAHARIQRALRHRGAAAEYGIDAGAARFPSNLPLRAKQGWHKTAAFKDFVIARVHYKKPKDATTFHFKKPRSKTLKKRPPKPSRTGR